MAVNVNEEQMKLVFELEMEMMADMYNRMASSCQKKCIPPRYNDSELNKGEAVCLDRCVAKFLEVHDQVGKKLTSISQENVAAKDLQAQMQQQQPT